jgi:hypothetical protein
VPLAGGNHSWLNRSSHMVGLNRGVAVGNGFRTTCGTDGLRQRHTAVCEIPMFVWIKSCATFAVILLAIQLAYGRDRDGRYANSPLHDWFEQLSSKKGPCCSDADGMSLSDVDWESHDGHYRVRCSRRYRCDRTQSSQGVDGLADLVERTPTYSLLHAGQHDLKFRPDQTGSVRLPVSEP